MAETTEIIFPFFVRRKLPSLGVNGETFPSVCNFFHPKYSKQMWRERYGIVKILCDFVSAGSSLQVSRSSHAYP